MTEYTGHDNMKRKIELTERGIKDNIFMESTFEGVILEK